MKPSKDEVRTMARSIARLMVKVQIKVQGHKVQSFEAKQITQAANTMLEQCPDITKWSERWLSR